MRFVTTLQQPATATRHEVGQVLELLRIQSGDLFVIGAIDEDGELVGTVIEELADLLRCTASGFAYVAEVLDAEHGVHRVRVRPSTVEGALQYSAQLPGGSAIDATALTIEADAASLTAEVLLGVAPLPHANICELRSLIRVGVPFNGMADSQGVVTLRQP